MYLIQIFFRTDELLCIRIHELNLQIIKKLECLKSMF